MDDTFAVVLNQRTPSHVYHDHRVTVIEKRAPTDESIRLFKELQEKAWDSVVNAFELKTILGSVNVIEYQEMEFFGRCFICLVNLNGKEIKVVTKIESRDLLKNAEEASSYILNTIVDNISREIATTIVVTHQAQNK